MSTRATISYVDNNKIHTIYCHFDGYIKGVGAVLATFYTTLEKVTELVSNGDASYIAEHINPDPTYEHSFENPQDNVCVFYHRDRNEPWEHNKPNVSDFNETTIAKVLGMQDYNYIFMNNKWYVYRRGDVGIYELTEDVVENDLPWEEEE